jgi:hypothetical protein
MLQSMCEFQKPEIYLHFRSCANRACWAIFTICEGCDRGQRYCRQECRTAERREQLRAASRRYQSSATGKEKHRLRQQAYRNRRKSPRVTHLPVQTIARSIDSRPSLSECVKCRVRSEWIDQGYDFTAETAATAGLLDFPSSSV